MRQKIINSCSARKIPWEPSLDTEGLENVTKVPHFTAALMNKGYSEAEIAKILGGNFLNLFKKVLG